MSDSAFVIREITPEDNKQIESIIRACFIEFELPLVGTAYEDDETPRMYESYQGNDEVYYVIANGDAVYGGAGIKKLGHFAGNVCELQKMYFSKTARGKGLGKQMFDKCLKAAEELGYEKCYLESASQLKAAIHIYESFGFEHLEGPLGNTGHYSCGVWMIRTL